MIDQFKRLRGYDPVPWMPALTGVLIGSREDSDKFLYDYRRTLADLMATEHYGTVAKVAHEHGLKVYGEALEDKRPSLGDDMAMRRHADIPMAAMWTHSRARWPEKNLSRRHQGRGLGGAYLWPEPGRGGIADRINEPLELCAERPQAGD